MAQVVYTNGLSVDSSYDVCGIPISQPIQDDPVMESSMGPVGGIKVSFLQGGVEKASAYTNAYGFFVVVLEEGDYDIQVRDDRFDDFDAEITLAIGNRAKYIGYRLKLRETGGGWDDLIITPPELRAQFLFGIVLMDRFGNLYPDDQIARFIRAETAALETICNISILQRKVYASAVAPEHPEDWDVIEPGYDYDFRDFQVWTYLRTRRRPLMKNIEVFKLIYPVGLSTFTIPKEWIRTYHIPGQIQLVPTAGAINRIFILPTGQFAPLISWYLPGQIPQVNALEYEVGLFEKGTRKPNPHVPSNLFDWARMIIGMMAAIDVLGVVGDAILAGVASQSISGDGISESYSTTASATSATFQARIESYRKDLNGRSAGDSGYLQKFKDYWSGIEIAVA